LRVLFVNPNAELGGSERSLLDLLAALGVASPEIERRLLLFSGGELAHRARALGVSVDVMPLPGALRTLGESAAVTRRAFPVVFRLARAVAALPETLLGLGRELRRLDPTVVHTNGMKAHLLCRMAAPGTPLVVHMRDFAGARPVSRSLLRAFASRNVTVVANSAAVARDLQRAVPSLTPRVIYNAIDLTEFRPAPRDLAPLAALSGMPVPPAGTVVVGLVATYAHWKGHSTFIDAMAHVKATLPDRPLRFYIIGGPIYSTHASEISSGELRRRIEERGLGDQLGLVPFQKDAGSAYRGLDIVVHASTRPEPFGRTIVEGMASGRAVVAAQAGGAVELLVEGETGLFHEPGDARGLARAVASLVSDEALRVRLASAARKSAEARFDRTRLAGEVSAVYRELLARRRDPDVTGSSSSRTEPRERT
jgi:glycosyltransferase involved in cell wall biosynthesis